MTEEELRAAEDAEIAALEEQLAAARQATLAAPGTSGLLADAGQGSADGGLHGRWAQPVLAVDRADPAAEEAEGALPVERTRLHERINERRKETP